MIHFQSHLRHGREQGSVRVLTGQAKGARLQSLRSSGLRPTSSLVRNAIFSALQARLETAAAVLDLYAGTGALGIEALSRGAATVDFVERDRRIASLIEQNLAAMKLSPQGHVYCGAALRILTSLKGPYDLILMDPPYESLEVPEILPLLVSLGLLNDGAIVVLEHAWRNGAPQPPPGLALGKTRRYGDTAVTYYIRMKP